MSFCLSRQCRKQRKKHSSTRLVTTDIGEATRSYHLTSGESLWDAAQQQVVVLVFLRHFGCTFTRQILRGLENVEHVAAEQHARLVLVHMLKDGGELKYLTDHTGIARIADPHCDLYRSFGLGKGGFLELFGPRVWFMGLLAIFQGCGVGHLAGDGRQMPGAFLFHRGKIIASQRAKDASELPNLPLLFCHSSSEPT
jgi:hypothetical protein